MIDYSVYKDLLIEKDNGILTITLNAPDSLNAFTAGMKRDCRDLWEALRVDDDVRVVVLTGAGDRAFCTGIDRNEPFTALGDSPGCRRDSCG